MKLFGYDIKLIRAGQQEVSRDNRLIPALLPQWSYGREWIKITDQTSQLSAFKSFVYIAASFNATKFASSILRLYAGKRSSNQKLYAPSRRLKTVHKDRMLKEYAHLKAVRQAEDIEEITEHPFLDLLDNVNGFMGRTDLFELTDLYEELCGEEYWYLVPGPLGIPQEIWPIPPDRMYIVPDEKQFISHYVYTRGNPGADQLILSKEEIIHFKFPNPKDVYHGASPLQAVADAHNLNQNINTFENTMFSNQLVSPGYFKVVSEPGRMGNRSLSDKEKTDLENDVRTVWAGAKNAGHTGVLDGLEWVSMNMSPKEMSYLQGRKNVKSEIFNAFGIPEALFDPVANRANAETAEYIHASYTLTPRLKRFEQKLNEQVLPLYDDKLFVAFDSVIQDDKDYNLREEEMNLRTGRWSLNEVRGQHGEEPIEGGDTHFISMGQVPLEMADLGIEAINAGVTEPAISR